MSSTTADQSSSATHRRRSSLSEALQFEKSSDSTGCSPKHCDGAIEDSASIAPASSASKEEAVCLSPHREDYCSQELTKEALAQSPISPWEGQGANDRSQSKLESSIGVAKSQSTTDNAQQIGREIEVSPFTPDDIPAYTLCPERPSRPSLSSNPLGVVPEDSVSPPEDMLLSSNSTTGADLVQPDALKLPKVKTPRTPAGSSNEADCKAFAPLEAPEDDKAFRSTESAEDFRIDFSRQQSEDVDTTFNPFASAQLTFPTTPEAVMSQAEDFFAMDFDSRQASQDIPFKVAHLDFGARNGSGVIGPKIDAAVDSRRGDKFEVHEGEDAEIKQLLWVIENLQEELHTSNAALAAAEEQIQERQAMVNKFQDDLKATETDNHELDERLRVMHSKLEAQLLTKLEQEDDIRVTWDKLKEIKQEMSTLDQSLAKAEEQRRDLERQVAQKRVTQQREQAENRNADAAGETSGSHSPRSNYSSAWETSESDEERLDLHNFTHRQSANLSEDNQAKMKEKGALGGSWLRSVLGGRSRKGIQQEPPPAAATAPDAADPEEEPPVYGGGHSHFEQPATAAELAPPEPDPPEEA